METRKIALALKENEELLASFYRVCIKLFPSAATEFERLAMEEDGHAQLFAKVIVDIDRHPDAWRPGKISLTTLTLIGAQIRRAMEEAVSGASAPRYALTFLRSAENSLGERHLEQALLTDNQEMSGYLQHVNGAFSQHLKRLDELERKLFPGPVQSIFSI
ncbi:MAG TPA: hypothetical protein PKO06_09550 [Candidatus Ozemobacteraceae bacterium]|nr:hypothetical protein [Candidatus Ozemobacteraceae bacterium]